jgi:hypothetical protein
MTAATPAGRNSWKARLPLAVPSDDPRYRRALFHLLAAETSCYRYWGQGVWTDYGAELSRRVADILTQF